MSGKRSMISSGKLLVASMFMLGMLTTVSQAYTMEEQQMCSGDAMRLCGAYIPDVERITACMTQKYELLSDGCKSVFEAPPAEANTAPAPTTYTPARPSKPLNLAPNPRRG